MSKETLDADALVAALTPPSVTVGGVTYKGRLLSYFEWMPFRDRLVRMGRGELGAAEAREFAEEYFRAVFPKRFLRVDPVPKLMVMPEQVIAQVLSHFFTCQLRALPEGLVPEHNGATPSEAGTTSLPEAPPSP